jgi:uncharacterized membrane protein YebE (DUF533 family)
MIDAKALLERFLGTPGTGTQTANPPAASPWGAPQRTAPRGGTPLDLGSTAQQVLGRMGGAGGVAAAGGLLAVLLSGKARKKGGGLLSHGGAAVLGALAHRAWQNWQSGQPPASAPVAGAQDAAAVDQRFLPGATPAAGDEPFELSLIRAMIGAARADGHIDAEERQRIFGHVEKAGLDAEAKAFVFDTIDAPIGVRDVAAAARTQEQAAELYLASRLTVDPDEAAERAYLQALAHRLQLPADLVAHLDRQADAVA